MESQLCGGDEAIVIGGGNSARQAAVFLAETARKVYMLVRGKTLSETMSRYLTQRIMQHPVIGIKRKYAEDKLRDSERSLRRLTETIPAMLWSAEADGAIDSCNQRVLDYTGLSPEQVRGAGWMKSVHRNEIEKMEQAWRTAVSTGEPFQYEFRGRRAADTHIVGVFPVLFLCVIRKVASSNASEPSWICTIGGKRNKHYRRRKGSLHGLPD